MLANQRQTPQSPGLPSSKTTAKYTNKDGSKFITIPKIVNGSDSAEPSPSMPETTAQSTGQMAVTPGESNGAPSVNRKKQKRRQKQAAKLAAEQQANQLNGTQKQMQELEARFRDHGLDDRPGQNGQYSYHEADEPYYSEEEADGYSGSYGPDGAPANGYAVPPPPPPPAPNTTAKKSKKKKKNKSGQAANAGNDSPTTNGQSHNQLPPLAPIQQPSTSQRGSGISKDKIWNTSSQEERERIKEFWLSLGEEERKSLVKVEKDAVLKKMKEQQKHSCSCTVCGRKRTAIEEELEVLYDAYYEELEQYANHQQGDGPPMIPPPRRFGAMNGLQPPSRLPPAFNGRQPSRGRIVEQLGDEEDDEVDEEYSDDDVDDDDYSEDEPEELPRGHATDFFNFGNSLTVQGGILTVADDLLKNDGKKFIEMMEQLAERRMAREEDAREQYASYGHPPNLPLHTHNHTHNHPPLPDDEEYDDEEEEEEEEDDYDSQEDDYDEEEMDTMTEEQRMEEGRRMFQIFAARMFEQRVLTAYKEKVAKERQQKLLEELEEESRADSQKKAKKAKEAQKKKDRMQQKKQALAEEKARREAEKAAEEAALREAEAKKAEEQRLKAEEKRKKKEAQKKAEEEERLRKEAEKQRRIQEQRERQAEIERKAREAKERERKEKEEQRRKEKEAKEAKEREAREKKERLEKERKEKETVAKAEKDATELQKRDEQPVQHTTAPAATPIIQTAKRIQQPVSSNVQAQPTAVASPLIPVAIPAVPKAPTPMKLRTSSQQESNSSVPATPQTTNKSAHDSPNTSTPSQGSPGPIGPPGKSQGQLPFLHHPQATSPIHSALKGPPGIPHGSFPPPMGMGPFQGGMPPVGAPGFGSRMHHDPMFPQQPMGGQFRPLSGPNGMPMHPGLMHPVPQGRGFSVPHGPPGFPPQMPNGPLPFVLPKDGPPQSHSRQSSASYDKTFEPHNGGPPAQPIARPAPIGRPGSVVHGQHPSEQHHMGKPDIDDLSNHLGSSALLDDSDEPIGAPRRMSGAPSLGRQNYMPSAPFGMEPPGFPSPLSSYNTWGTPPNPFGSSLPGSGFMGGWPSHNSSFSSVGGAPPIRPSQPRSVAIRLMMIRACRNLQGSTPDGFFDINAVKEQLEAVHSPRDEPLSEKEILDICDTEGNATNGGGSFEVRNDSGRLLIRYESDVPANHRPVGAPGEIGSPIVGSGGVSRFPGPPPGLSPGGF